MTYAMSDVAGAWQKKVSVLEGVIKGLTPRDPWVSEAFSSSAFDKLTDSLENDIRTLKTEAGFIFASGMEAESLSRLTTDLIRDWQVSNQGPSLTALSIAGLEHFGITQPDLVQAVLMASVLGEIPNDLEYHNNMHYRKVLLQALRLAAAHNDIFAGTSRAFGPEQICLLMIGACVHDLGHDGKGNTVRGVFQAGRLERKSFAIALPYLQAAGLTDQTLLDDLRVMILCTEVTPLDDPGNPMNQMKAAYRFHFLGDKLRTHTLNLERDLEELQYDETLTTLSVLLHEADIATSAGLDYSVTKYETTIYMKEISKLNARPQYVIDFLNQICQRKILSDAGQRLYAGNLARIYALAFEDVKNGDSPFPEPQHSDFFLASKSAGLFSKTKH